MGEDKPASVITWFTGALASLTHVEPRQVLGVVRALRERQRSGDLDALHRNDVAAMARQAESFHAHHAIRAHLLERLGVGSGGVAAAAAAPSILMTSGAWRAVGLTAAAIFAAGALFLYVRAQLHKLAAEELRGLIGALNDLCKPNAGPFRTNMRVDASTPTSSVADNDDAAHSVSSVVARKGSQ